MQHQNSLIAPPLLMLAFVAASPAEAQTIDTNKRFSMQVQDPKTNKPVSVSVDCNTLNAAKPNEITLGFAEQFHRALSNMGNLGDFKLPADKSISAGPLIIHMKSVHGFGPIMGSILEGRASPADIERYKADPSRDFPVIGAKWVCEGKSEKLSPIYKYDPASSNITLDFSKF